jgi:hypothetical protein
MLHIKYSALAQALQESGAHIFTATQGANGYYTLVIDDKALLETERGRIRAFRKLDALANLLESLGIGQFSVKINPALVNAKNPQSGVPK